MVLKKYKMKNLILTLFTICLLNPLFAQIKTPQPSPTCTIQQTVGVTDVSITYSRPGAKGRTIFGDLVPYNKMWRTGANKATAISFSNDIIVDKYKLKKGTYSLFTIPGESEWTVMLNSDTELWGAGDYNKEKEVISFKVESEKTADFTETFTIEFSNFTSKFAKLTLKWENTAITIPLITTDNERLAGQFMKALNEGPDANLYYNGARYFLENDLDLALALEWINVATEKRPEAFWMQYQKARILGKSGNKKEAIQAAEKVISVASEKEDDYGYIAKAEKLIKELKAK